MGKLKLETQRRVEHDRMRGQEIVECGEERLEEAEAYAHAPIFNPLEDIEAIDIDDITALMECGKKYTVEELVEQFGISVDAAKAVLAPCNHIDIAKAIAEAENTEAIDSVFSDADLSESAEPFDDNLPLNKITEFSDEELAQMVYELEHAFD